MYLEWRVLEYTKLAPGMPKGVCLEYRRNEWVCAWNGRDVPGIRVSGIEIGVEWKGCAWNGLRVLEYQGSMNSLEL